MLLFKDFCTHHWSLDRSSIGSVINTWNIVFIAVTSQHKNSSLSLQNPWAVRSPLCRQTDRGWDSLVSTWEIGVCQWGYCFKSYCGFPRSPPLSTLSGPWRSEEGSEACSCLYWRTQGDGRPQKQQSRALPHNSLGLGERTWRHRLLLGGVCSSGVVRMTCTCITVDCRHSDVCSLGSSGAKSV